AHRGAGAGGRPRRRGRAQRVRQAFLVHRCAARPLQDRLRPREPARARPARRLARRGRHRAGSLARVATGRDGRRHRRHASRLPDLRRRRQGSRRARAGGRARVRLSGHASSGRRPRRVGRVRARGPRAGAERTITVIGERMGPNGDDPLPWDELGDADAVYFTAGDAEALRAARVARQLVATTRANEVLVPAQVQLDVLVRSARDPGEQYVELEPPPRFVAETNGTAGGTLLKADGSATRWAAAPLPGPAVDAYGAGDSFAAGLTFALASGKSPGEAVELGARCGAICMAGRGPYGASVE